MDRENILWTQATLRFNPIIQRFEACYTTTLVHKHLIPECGNDVPLFVIPGGR